VKELEIANLPGDGGNSVRHLAGLFLFAARYFLSGPDEEIHGILGDSQWWALLRETGLANGEPRGKTVDLDWHRSAFETLFRIPGDGFVPPYEQAYHEGKATVNLSATAECAKVYQAAGYEAAPFAGVQRDHIGHHLRFLSALLEREADCLDRGEVEAAERVVTWEEGFLADRCWWWPRFVERVRVLEPPAEVDAANLLISGLHAALGARGTSVDPERAGRTSET